MPREAIGDMPLDAIPEDGNVVADWSCENGLDKDVVDSGVERDTLAGAAGILVFSTSGCTNWALRSLVTELPSLWGTYVRGT